jgi:hypothetical protein
VAREGIPEDWSNLEERVFWNHSAKTYQAWFDQGAETFPVAETELQNFYGQLLRVLHRVHY